MWAKQIAYSPSTQGAGDYLARFFSDSKFAQNKHHFFHFKTILGIAFDPKYIGFFPFLGVEKERVLAFLTEKLSDFYAQDKSWFFKQFPNKLLKDLIEDIRTGKCENAQEHYRKYERLSQYFPADDLFKTMCTFDQTVCDRGRLIRKKRDCDGVQKPAQEPSFFVDYVPSPFNPSSAAIPPWDL